MTIMTQWLIFGGIGIAMFAVGFFARKGSSESSPKEEHSPAASGQLNRKRDEQRYVAASAAR
jgi:hypothetical protein